jgi:hypothetical protein
VQENDIALPKHDTLGIGSGLDFLTTDGFSRLEV